ncbi:hypothetical protein [Leptospira noguchii]|uniref:Uncharacterized protein n=1 Tax=Leptospira noguchii TaxID=28182 RepID=A0AAE9GCD6_9LEPT|nr:hypothetical protein [Leptospira noguchii]UOG51805.1 hypothetical protein MAL09_14225 [Leptospira noguchii]UOG57514.1 hypothetical protein MAL03_05050 [Leptospira noguchii]
MERKELSKTLFTNRVLDRSRKLKRLTLHGSFEETKASHSPWIVRGN